MTAQDPAGCRTCHNTSNFFKRLIGSKIIRIQIFSIRSFYSFEITIIHFIDESMFWMFTSKRSIEYNLDFFSKKLFCQF